MKAVANKNRKQKKQKNQRRAAQHLNKQSYLSSKAVIIFINKFNAVIISH